MREYNITSASLLKRVGMQTMTSYLARPQLLWLGHVARMLPPRTPNQLLMAEFMNCKRCVLLTYGKSITNMMKLVAYAFPTQPSYSSLIALALLFTRARHTPTPPTNSALR
jgi:hypothetical protein